MRYESKVTAKGNSSYSYRSQEVADLRAKLLDAQNCIDCIGCIYCTNCMYCIDCNNCTNCVDCIYCNNCINCKELTGGAK